MAGSNGATAAAAIQQLRGTLEELAELRERRDNTKAAAEAALESYKRHESVAAQAMQDAGLTSVKLDNLGQFTVQSRVFVKVQDLAEVMKWAEAAGMLEGVEVREDGKIVIPFEQIQEIDEATGKPSLLLVNGIISAKPRHKPISDHTKEVVDNTDMLPEGVSLSTSTYITMRRK